MEGLGAPYRIVLLLMGLIVLASLAGVFLLPLSSHFREHILRLDLMALAYMTVLYALSRRPSIRPFRYLISITNALFVTVAHFEFKEYLPGIPIFYIFIIVYAVLLWDAATTIFTAALSTLGYATVIALTGPFVAHHALDAGLMGVAFFLTAALAGVGVKQLRLRTEQLSALNAVAQTLSQSLELDTALSAALDKVLETLEFESGAIYVKDMETGELEMKQHRGLSEEFRRAVAKGIISARVADSGKPIVIDDLSQDPKAPKVVVAEGYRPLASIPLLSKGQVQGVLTIASRQLRRFCQQDVDLLLSIGNQIGVAIENARLYQAEESKSYQLAKVLEIGEDLKLVLELDRLLERIAHVVRATLGFNMVTVNVISEDGKAVVTRALAGLPQEGKQKLLGAVIPMTELNPLLQDRFKISRSYFISHEAQVWDERTDKFTYIPDSEDWKEGQWHPEDALLVPLESREERLVGLLSVDDPVDGKIPSLETIHWLEIFANQAAIAIENAHLYEETQKRLRETTALHRVSEVINSTLDLQEIFQRVMEELSNTFSYRLVDIYLLEEDGLRLQANAGYDAETTIELIPLERGVVGRVARTGQPAFIRDVSQGPDYIDSYPDITSEICVPIKSGQTLLGILNVECDDKRPLTDDDLQLLSTLSSHIGVAIENARLYEEEQRRGAQRRTIAEVGRRAAAILEMDTLLPQVVDLIARNFGYYLVHVFEVDADAGYVVFKASTGEANRILKEEGFRLRIGEEGMIGWVARHVEPLLANDVSLDPHYVPHPALPDTRSELAVPIRLGEKIIGVLDVQSAELDAFDEGDLETLQTLADQLAVAMENARLYEETKRLAITDGLTGLYNLRYFYEELEKEIQRSERYHRSVSLIILDIDDFKAYNDLYGHLAGDDLLIELAQLMSKVTRQSDTLARYGGEEFVIILPETETEPTRFLAQRLQQEVKEHRFSTQDGQTIGRITISLGVATYPHHADSAKALVDAADKALLRAKRAGKNRLSVCGEELTQLEPR